MRYTLIAAAVMTSLFASNACGQQPTAVSAKHTTSMGKPAASAAKAAPGEDFAWGPAPAIFPAGAQMAVLQGNPAGTEMFTVRLRFPNGYKIAPHTHPTDEHVTVISGHFKVGMGETADAKAMMTLKPGGFVTAPANHAHYAAAVGPTVVQVSAIGPFAMTYVNPADTPAAAKQ
jgi:quercetin dioxygenase-like cupin family protein